MAIFTCLFIVFKDQLNNDAYEMVGRLLLGLLLAAYVTVSMTLAGEGRGTPRKFVLQALAVLGICGLAWVSKALKLNLFMLIGAAVLLLGNSILWRRPRNDLHVWDFTHKLWTGAGFAAAGSFIFMLGLFAISSALKSLFGVNMNKLVEDIILPIGFGFLAPIYWLAVLPPVDEDYSELYENPGFVSKAVAFMGTWLLSPLTLIYALILLAYSFKIVIAGELPKGEIAQLTTPFLLVGTTAWLVLDPPFAKDKWLARVFRRFWWLLSIPAALMLLTAVWVRVGEYGFTPERILLSAIVVWSLGLALWFGFGPKEKRDIRFIPGAAAGLLVAAAFSVSWIAQHSQGARFERNLIAAGIMESSGKIPAAPQITNMLAARHAKGAFQYLMQNDGQSKIAKTLDGSGAAFDADTATSKDILARLGLIAVKIPNRKGMMNSTYYNDTNAAIPVEGFEKIFGVHSLYRSSFADSAEQILFSNGTLKVTAHDGKARFVTGELEAYFDFNAWVKTQNFGPRDIEGPFDPIAVVDTPAQGISLFITNIQVSNHDGDEAGFSVSFYTLTRGID
jgi:hypothetical protein